MRQVVPPISIVQKILGEQKPNEGTLHRLTAHCLWVERPEPEGVLLYHTLTGELLLLSYEEAALLGRLPGPVPPALGELVPKWFLRPEGSDDMALADQTRKIADRFCKKKTALTKYSVFTTTACNARCFYCFETGWETRTMTERTARDTAAYIGAHRGGKQVHIKWFGGEPLVNVRAIDVITDCLREQAVPFISTISSNGYLFDETLICRAKEKWNLEQLQTTLDGTEEVYNARKAYVHPAGSPYQRVLGNIGLLLDADVRVNVRLNMDGDNEKDLYALVDQLSGRFGGKFGFDVYPTAIWENEGIDPPSYTEAERRVYAEKLRALRTYVEDKGLAEREMLANGYVVSSCSADTDSCTVVMPDGKLSRCTVPKDGAIWGSIYSEERDEQVICQWKERKPPEASCQTCPVYPQCIRLKKCPMWLEHCAPIERTYREDRLRRAIQGAYEEWKAASQS